MGDYMKKMALLLSKRSVLLLLGYIIIATSWVFITDHFVQPMANESETAYLLVSLKDWIFIVVSGLVLVYVASRKREVQQDLTNTEQKFQKLFEHSSDGIMLTNPNGAILKINPAGCRILGRQEEEIIKLGREGITRNDEKMQEALKRREETGHFSGELTFIHKTGKDIPVELTSSVFEAGNGDQQTSIIFRDITDRKQAEQQLQDSLDKKNTLLAEIHHRIKNNLAVISGLLEVQALEAEDEQVRFTLHDSQQRVQTIATIHEKLYQNNTLAEICTEGFIEDLISSIHDAHNPGNQQDITYQTDIEDIGLDMDQAIPIGLIVNELVSNTYKHAFEGQKQGHVSIHLESEDDTMCLRVTDNGKGLPEDFTLQQSNSLGMNLIQTLTHQLEGKLEYQNTENGCEFTVTVPMP